MFQILLDSYSRPTNYTNVSEKKKVDTCIYFKALQLPCKPFSKMSWQKHFVGGTEFVLSVDTTNFSKCNSDKKPVCYTN